MARTRRHLANPEFLKRQGDLFAPDPARLPSEGELLAMFHRFNQEYFAGTLPVATIRWSTRMRIAGCCYPTEREIRLSRHYHTHYPEEVRATLLHEMLHLIYPSHNTRFKAAAERLGISVYCKDYPGAHPRSKYTYVCPGCGEVYHRQKRANMSCGKCSGKTYDPRYKLVLTRAPQDKKSARRLR